MARLTAPAPGRPYALIAADGAQTLADIPDDEIVPAFKRHGALLFRGFPADLEAFRVFATRFCSTSVFNESPNRRLLDPATNIQSVDGGTGAFPLHPELSREPWKPDACFFHCLTPPASGGETTLCDGVEIVRALPAEVRDGLAGRRLVYLRPVPPWEARFWFGTEIPSPEALADPPAGCPYSFLTIDGHLVRAFSRPAFHTPMFTEQPAFGNFLLFARYQNRRRDVPLLDDGSVVPGEWVETIKKVGDGLAAAVVWQTGDLLVLDNSRFMHGRNAILDPGSRLIATYFGYLRFAPVNPEEAADPIWRRETFRPPMPPKEW